MSRNDRHFFAAAPSVSRRAGVHITSGLMRDGMMCPASERSFSALLHGRAFAGTDDADPLPATPVIREFAAESLRAVRFHALAEKFQRKIVDAH